MPFPLARPSIARVNAITQTRLLSSKTANTFPPWVQRQQLSTASASTPKAQSEEDPLRPCGAQLNSQEAGPRDPSGILRPEFWIVMGSGILTGVVVYFISPFSSSKSGQATALNELAGRRTSERSEGYTGREETAEEMADEKNIRIMAAKERKATLTKE